MDLSTLGQHLIHAFAPPSLLLLGVGPWGGPFLFGGLSFCFLCNFIVQWNMHSRQKNCSRWACRKQNAWDDHSDLPNFGAQLQNFNKSTPNFTQAKKIMPTHTKTGGHRKTVIIETTYGKGLQNTLNHVDDIQLKPML